MGGTEDVLEFPIDMMGIESHWVNQFPIQVGAVEYGFAMDGILGLDFLRVVNAIIDLDLLEIRFSDSSPV